MRVRHNISCPRGATRALAIGKAVEEVERDGGGDVFVHHPSNEDEIVLQITVETTPTPPEEENR